MRLHHLQLTNRAFKVLELLPAAVAFDLFRKLDRLAAFPLMGTPLESRFPELKGFRQLIYDRHLRIIYEFDENDDTVYVLAINNCRQKLPTPRELRRDRPLDDELPLE